MLHASIPYFSKLPFTKPSLRQLYSSFGFSQPPHLLYPKQKHFLNKVKPGPFFHHKILILIHYTKPKLLIHVMWLESTVSDMFKSSPSKNEPFLVCLLENDMSSVN